MRRMVPESRCSVRIRLDAPEMNEEEENIDDSTEHLNSKDRLLITLRQSATKDVCCAKEDIIEDEKNEDDKRMTCGEKDGAR